MREFQHYIFDLDGTITHPQQGIVGGYRYAFDQLGFPDKPDEELIPLIGPPLKYVFSVIYKLSPEETEAGIQYYRDYYYGKGGMYEAIIFEGMRDIFECLKAKNKTLHIATNKSLQVDKILSHFGVLNYFKHIEHYSEEKGIVTKERMIENILIAEEVRDNSSVVMIGDREHDLQAAKNVGVAAIGVLHGFGSREELQACEPYFIAENVSELRSVLCPF